MTWALWVTQRSVNVTGSDQIREGQFTSETIKSALMYFNTPISEVLTTLEGEFIFATRRTAHYCHECWPHPRSWNAEYISRSSPPFGYKYFFQFSLLRLLADSGLLNMHERTTTSPLVLLICIRVRTVVPRERHDAVSGNIVPRRSGHDLRVLSVE